MWKIRTPVAVQLKKTKLIEKSLPAWENLQVVFCFVEKMWSSRGKRNGKKSPGSKAFSLGDSSLRSGSQPNFG